MLVNKWLITDNILIHDQGMGHAGICLFLPSEPSDISRLYKSVQQIPVKISFAILLSGEHFNKNGPDDTYIAKIIGLFFMPSYGLTNYQPVLFIQNETPGLTRFLERLAEKCKRQGIRNIVVRNISLANSNAFNDFVYLLNTLDGFDFNEEITRWINENIKGNNPAEITLLIPENDKENINSVLESEKKIKETNNYRIAIALYQKQQLIDESNHALYLKAINEKNVRFYLSIQKEERAKGLKYYYYEYEILPKWYKQFGHIIKVIMGKRTFKSLFSDNVKKYKD